MKEPVSALMDGESSDQEAAQILGAMERDDALKTTWDEYHLIGDALRNNALLSVNVRKQVESRLAGEPTVLAPRAKRPVVPLRMTTWALAATVTFAAVVGWQQLGKDSATGMQVTQVAHVVKPAEQPMGERDSSYLLAHQELAADPNLMKASVESGVRH